MALTAPFLQEKELPTGNFLTKCLHFSFFRRIRELICIIKFLSI